MHRKTKIYYTIVTTGNDVSSSARIPRLPCSSLCIKVQTATHLLRLRIAAEAPNSARELCGALTIVVGEELAIALTADVDGDDLVAEVAGVGSGNEVAVGSELLLDEGCTGFKLDLDAHGGAVVVAAVVAAIVTAVVIIDRLGLLLVVAIAVASAGDKVLDLPTGASAPVGGYGDRLVVVVGVDGGVLAIEDVVVVDGAGEPGGAGVGEAGAPRAVLVHLSFCDLGAGGDSGLIEVGGDDGSGVEACELDADTDLAAR